MRDAFLIVGPIFGLIAAGALAARFRLVGPATATGLSEYVFLFAIPALLFRTIATASLPNIDPTGYYLSYFLPLALCWLLGSLAARHLFRADPIETVIAGFASAQANTALIGIPLVLRSYGEAAMAPVLWLLAAHLPITMFSATLFIETSGGKRPPLSELLHKLFAHPIILGIGAGILWRFTGLGLAEPVGAGLKLLADSAAPAALVATGLTLAQHGISGRLPQIAVSGVIKTLVHPLLVYVLAAHVFALEPMWVGAGMLFAACPTGVNAYLLAERYRTGVAFTSGLIAATTLAATATVTLLLVTIGLPGR